MDSTIQVGQRVRIVEYWTGMEGIVVRIYPLNTSYHVLVEKGDYKGEIGAFNLDQIEALDSTVSRDQIRALLNLIGED